MNLAMVLLIIALVFLVINAIGKLPLWPAVLMLIVLEFVGRYHR
jgi:hypothetical protein